MANDTGGDRFGSGGAPDNSWDVDDESVPLDEDFIAKAHFVEDAADLRVARLNRIAANHTRQLAAAEAELTGRPSRGGSDGRRDRDRSSFTGHLPHPLILALVALVIAAVIFQLLTR